MKKTFLILAFALSSLTFFGQNIRQNTNMISISKTSEIDVIPKEVQKKQYLNFNFVNANISNVDQASPLRFNIYKDEMEYMKNNEVFYLRKTEDVEIKFPSINKRYTVKNYNDNLTYFVNLLDGDFKLLLKENVKFIAASEPDNSYGSATSASYKRGRDQFFIINDQGEISLVSRKKKAFLKLFNKKSNEVKSFMKEKNLSHKKRKDLVEIVAYYNQL
jgi:hypothetical protein